METEEKQNKIYLWLGLLLTVSEIYKQYMLWELNKSISFQLSYLPFQLCSLPMYVCILIYVFKNMAFRRILVIFLSDFSLLSGAAAFLDTTGMYYGFLPLTLNSYLWHICIIMIGVYSGIAAGRRRLKEYIPAAAVFLTGCAVAELINIGLDRYGIVDMFYINPHNYVNQIVFSAMTGIMPNNAVIAIYILSIALAAFIVHLIWMRLYRKNSLILADKK